MDLEKEIQRRLAATSEDGLYIIDDQWLWDDMLPIIADLIREEREACAGIADSYISSPHRMLTTLPPKNGTAWDISAAIRARSQEGKA